MIASGQHLTRLRPGVLLDSYGDPVGLDWSNPETTRLNRATIKRGTAVDLKDLTGHAVATTGTAYVEGAVDLAKDDRLAEPDGTVWEVTGEGVIHHGLAGRHTIAALKRLT